MANKSDKEKDKDRKIIIPFGIFLGASVLAVALYLINRRKKNGDGLKSTVSNGSITASTVVSGGGGGGGGTVSSIVAQNQTLNSVNAGTNGISISLSALTATNCAETANRTITEIGSGISLKKNGTAMAVNSTFIATDILTYDVASTVAATSGKTIFRYKANGVCGDSNVATITANITSNGGTNSLTAFPFKDAYLNGSTYVNYASLVDGRDKNYENSGFTNRTATVYTTAMETGNIAYSDAAGTIIYPAGNYFDDVEFRFFAINAQGVMYLFSDTEKTGLSEFIISQGYN
jgi:hypothetical protein